MGLPAARMLIDRHLCAVCALVAPMGTPILLGSFNVITAGMPQSRMTDPVICALPEFIALASMTVLVNGLPAARVADLTSMAGVIVPPGAITVLIG